LERFFPKEKWFENPVRQDLLGKVKVEAIQYFNLNERRRPYWFWVEVLGQEWNQLMKRAGENCRKMFRLFAMRKVIFRRL
jgi:hypothetical protein